MKKLIFLFFLFTLLIPLITGARGLVPCGGPDEDPCTACDLLVLFENVLHYALTLAFTIVIVFAIVAGFRWIFSGGNEANIQAGQKGLTNALIGLAIILCSWLIVNTLFWLVAQIGGENYTGTWWQIKCEKREIGYGTGGSGTGGSGTGGSGTGGSGPSENWCSDMEGYACVSTMEGWPRWNPNCAGATVVLTDPNITHCPEGTICCVPADPSKIIAEPKNPEPPNQGGPCEGGGLMTYCSNYTVCRTVKNCDTQQYVTYCAQGSGHLCPPCPDECAPDDPNACK